VILPITNESGNISLRNIQQLLEFGEYVDPKSTEFKSAERLIEIRREILHYQIKIEFTDITSNFKSAQWNRVVAVFI